MPDTIPQRLAALTASREAEHARHQQVLRELNAVERAIRADCLHETVVTYPGLGVGLSPETDLLNGRHTINVCVVCGKDMP
jgi:hypothetical protein